MATETPGTTTTASLTLAERRSLRSLRRRYQENHDLFSRQELARLGFLRWLVQSGRVAP
ncbi:MAG TPA: hypothetical protein VKX16_08865 [Chloroflexota bacterium]|nr:hypothetical protein [Chloroflexota bacterium]